MLNHPRADTRFAKRVISVGVAIMFLREAIQYCFAQHDFFDVGILTTTWLAAMYMSKYIIILDVVQKGTNPPRNDSRKADSSSEPDELNMSFVPAKEILERLKKAFEFFPWNFNVLQDFFKETFADILSFMKRNHCAAAISMAEEHMTSLLSNAFESQGFQYTDYKDRFKRNKFTHAEISISCKPTNLRLAGRSASRQTWIASFIRFKSVSKVLPWLWQPFELRA